MLYYYFKILMLLLFNSIIFKTFLIFWLVYGSSCLRRFLPKYIITLDKMRINFMFFYILNTLVFILVYICLLGYWRFLNTNRNLNLKMLIYRNYYFFKNNNIYDTILLLVVIIVTVVFCYYAITFFKRYYFYHFLKIHIFIVYLSQYKDLYKETTYEKIIHKFTHLSSFFYRCFIDKPIDYCCDLYLTYVDPEYESLYKETIYEKIMRKIIKLRSIFKHYIMGHPYIDISFRRYTPAEYKAYSRNSKLLFNLSWKIQNKLNLPKHGERFPIYLLIFSILYDIVYNDMLLNKFYYISFLLFFYYLFQKLTDIMCCLYSGDCVTIYDYLYVGENELNDEVIQHVNKELLRVAHYGKQHYSLVYDENRLIKLSWSTYLCILNILMIIHIFLFSKFEVLLDQQMLNATLVVVVIMIQIIILWVFVGNIIVENIFLVTSSIIGLLWLLLLSKHNLPLLFNEILLEIPHIKIVTSYTIEEKLLFLNEYLMLKIKCLSLDQQFYFLKIIKSIPVYELLQSKNIDEIKDYIENLIDIFVYLENTSYPLLKIDVQNQVIIAQQKFNFIEKPFSAISKLIKTLLKIKFK